MQTGTLSDLATYMDSGAVGHRPDADGAWTQTQTVFVRRPGPLPARSDRYVCLAKMAILRGASVHFDAAVPSSFQRGGHTDQYGDMIER